MSLQLLTLQQALNKNFLRIKPSRIETDRFRENLVRLLDCVDDTKSEDFYKIPIAEFLNVTYYEHAYYINIKDKNDLVIHNDNHSDSSVAVIFEVKNPFNKTEMVTPENLNTKAFHELVLYYLRERITYQNLNIRHLIITNINEWFIFDAVVFDQIFAQNKTFVDDFIDFEDGRLINKKTDFFYKNLAAPFIRHLDTKIKCTYFKLSDYSFLLQDDRYDDRIIEIYKIFSPTHLLKLPFANDHNNLDRDFYEELLHIIGVTEIQRGGKFLIERCETQTRNPASILEETITQLDSLNKINRLTNPNQYGCTESERLFNVALELSITWLNRILFIKLLEAQLLLYHKKNPDYFFLHSEKIKNYSDLGNLFFKVLAKKPEERDADVKELFKNVPYLNSSLFEPTDLEQETLVISNLTTGKFLPIFETTVLKDRKGKKRTGKQTTLEYLFDFLNAYNFGSDDEQEKFPEENKTLINAAVLGLIFEKINGYKDGSFFTPGFITMSMCRETIQKAVIQKFNKIKNWECRNLTDIYNHITVKDINEAINIINSIKICDPAVGSGHFLVSALNELIATKSRLGLLMCRDGKLLKEYKVDVVNDELVLSDAFQKRFKYIPNNPEARRIQETLFHEKQRIIENCLFGVDINHNSVQICRLRLWIELLKNAYYKNETELETLPNLDINIKYGNSLISRFAVDAEITSILKRHHRTIEDYRSAIEHYHHAQNREQKREMLQLITSIKNDFQNEIIWNIPQKTRCDKLEGELYRLTNQKSFIKKNKTEKADKENKIQYLKNEITRLKQEVTEIKSNKIFENAFEWRFEFPEILDADGRFLGFDIVIGNPPYGVKYENGMKEWFKHIFSDIHVRTPESYNYFIKLYSIISGEEAFCCFIIPSGFLSQVEFEKTRKLILTNYSPYLILNLGDAVFDVTVPTCIIGFGKQQNSFDSLIYEDLSAAERRELPDLVQKIKNQIKTEQILNNQFHSFVYQPYSAIIDKCYKNSLPLREIANVTTGVSTGFDKAYVFKQEEIKKKKLEKNILKKLVIGGEMYRYYMTPKTGKKLIYITDEHNIDDFPNIKTEMQQYKVQLLKRREAANGVRKWFAVNWARQKKLFEKPKILIRQTANRIMASFDDEKWYCLKSGIIVQLSNEGQFLYKYLLGLLNSKLMNFLYKNLVNENNRIFPEVKPVQLAKLPIKTADIKKQRKIETLVNRIIVKKTKNALTNTSDLEKQIDELLYEIYDLTNEEINIVEKEN
jgi:hypothetical protein